MRVVVAWLVVIAVILATLGVVRRRHVSHLDNSHAGKRPRSMADVERMLDAIPHPTDPPTAIISAAEKTTNDGIIAYHAQQASVVFTNEEIGAVTEHGRLTRIPPRGTHPKKSNAPFLIFVDLKDHVAKTEQDYQHTKYRLVSIAQHENATSGIAVTGQEWIVLNPRPHPRLIYCFNTLSDAEAGELMEYASVYFQRSFVNSRKDGHPEKNPVRTSYGMFMAATEQREHPINVKLRERVAAIAGFPALAAEATQILKYKPGQFYKPHLDTFRRNNYETLRRGGQRILTAVTFLNDCGHTAAGGCETSFPVANVSVTPHVGNTVIFYDVNEDFETIDSFSMHGGSPPIAGESKYIAVLWFHARPFT